MAKVVRLKKPENILKNYGFNEFISMVVDNIPTFKNASGMHRAIRVMEALQDKKTGKMIEWLDDDYRLIRDTIMHDQFQFPTLPYQDPATGAQGAIPSRMFMSYMIAIRDAQVIDSEGPDEETRAQRRADRKAKRKGSRK